MENFSENFGAKEVVKKIWIIWIRGTKELDKGCEKKINKANKPSDQIN